MRRLCEASLCGFSWASMRGFYVGLLCGTSLRLPWGFYVGCLCETSLRGFSVGFSEASLGLLC